MRDEHYDIDSISDLLTDLSHAHTHTRDEFTRHKNAVNGKNSIYKATKSRNNNKKHEILFYSKKFDFN